MRNLNNMNDSGCMLMAVQGCVPKRCCRLCLLLYSICSVQCVCSCHPSSTPDRTFRVQFSFPHHCCITVRCNCSQRAAPCLAGRTNMTGQATATICTDSALLNLTYVVSSGNGGLARLGFSAVATKPGVAIDIVMPSNGEYPLPLPTLCFCNSTVGCQSQP